MIRTSDRIREVSSRLYDWANGERPSRFEEVPRAPAERKRDRRAMVAAAAGTLLVAGGVIAGWSALVLPIRKMTPLVERPVVAAAPSSELAAAQLRSDVAPPPGDEAPATPAQARPAPAPARLPPPRVLPPPGRQPAPQVVPAPRPQTPLGGVDAGVSVGPGMDAGTTYAGNAHRPGPRPGSIAAPPAYATPGGSGATQVAQGAPAAPVAGAAPAPGAAPVAAPAPAEGVTPPAAPFAPQGAGNAYAQQAPAGTDTSPVTYTEQPATAPATAPRPAPAPSAPATPDALANDVNALRMRLNATRLALANLPPERRTESRFHSVVQRVTDIESRLASAAGDTTQLSELFNIQAAAEQDLASLQGR